MSLKQSLQRKAVSVFGVTENREDSAQRFLESHAWLLKTELDYGMDTNHSKEEIYTQITLPNLKRPDFIRREWSPSDGWRWEFIEIEPPGISPLTQKGTYSKRLNEAVTQVREWRRYAASQPHAMHDLFPGFTPPLYGRVIIGRSELLDPTQRDLWRLIRKENQYITIRTYTWLIEKLARLSDDVIARVAENGSAKVREDLIKEREYMLAYQNQPFGSYSPASRSRTHEIRELANTLQSEAESGIFPRTLATAFESMVKGAFPALRDLAQEIRETVHDLENREPNVTVEELIHALRQFHDLLDEQGY